MSYLNHSLGEEEIDSHRFAGYMRVSQYNEVGLISNPGIWSHRLLFHQP